MTTRTEALDKKIWKPYLDHASKLLDGNTVEIEVAALNLGSQVAAEWLPLHGLMYDETNDLIAVMAEGLDHMIRRPREVYTQADGVQLLSMEVIDGDGAAHIVRLKQPLLLAAH